MGRFRVHLQTVATGWVEVEADDAGAAAELVMNEDVELPYAPGFADYEFEEWQLPSEFDSKLNGVENDVTELGDGD